MDDTAIAAAEGSPVPAILRVRGALVRRLALAGFVATAAFQGWMFWMLAHGGRLLVSEVPLLFAAGILGLVTATLAVTGLRGATLWPRVGMILMSLGALAAAGWNLFAAFIVAVFPKC